MVGGDLWVPIGMQASGLATQSTLEGRFNNFLLGVGRLAPGSSLQEARAAGAVVMDRIAEEFPTLDDWEVAMAPLGALPGFVRLGVTVFLTALMVVVGLMLMIACVNVAGMLLSRSLARQKEIAVRLAMGASRGRLVRQLLTESLILFLAGGIGGVLIAVWATGLLEAMNPPTPPPFVFTFDFGVEQRVLGFSLLLTLATGLVFGLGPALRASRPQLVPSLKDEMAVGAFRRSRLRGFLLAGQMAMTVLLLVAAGLFLRALVSARTIDPGFNPDGVVGMTMDVQLHGYDAEGGKRFYRELREQVDQLPGVETSSVAALMPLGLPANIGFGGVNVQGFDPPEGRSSWQSYVNITSPGYFDTLEIPLLQGRDFDERDVAGAANVAIINQAMARRFWPEGDAVGKQFIMGSFDAGTPYEVIGVARDAKYHSLTAEGLFFTYVPIEQQYRSAMSLMVRGREGTTPPIEAIRAVLARLDPDIPPMEVVGLREYVEIAYLPQRVAGSVAGILGVVGLLIGAVGIYGVTAYAVGQRTQEIGIRKALGAGGREVLRLVVRQGMFAPLAGMAVGFLLAWVVATLLGAFLFRLSPLDPVTFGGVLLVLGGVAFLANWLPARRAAKIDPMAALRYE